MAEVHPIRPGTRATVGHGAGVVVLQLLGAPGLAGLVLSPVEAKLLGMRLIEQGEAAYVAEQEALEADRHREGAPAE